jgi:hypothetical protein
MFFSLPKTAIISMLGFFPGILPGILPIKIHEDSRKILEISVRSWKFQEDSGN